MSGLLRKAMLLACCGVLSASSAMAALPSPADSSVPCGLNLVGTDAGGVADVKGAFTITVRDVAQNPIPGSSVVIDFDACTPDIQLCVIQPAGGVSIACATGVGEVSGVTNGSGQVTFRIVGSAKQTGVGNVPGAGFKCATVYADGVNIGTINVHAFDQNSAGGAQAADISYWLSDYFNSDHFTGPYRGRSDYDCNHDTFLPDLSLLLAAIFGLGSTTSCSNYCP